MAKWVEALGAKPDDPSSIPWTYMVEGKNQLLQAVPPQALTNSFLFGCLRQQMKAH